MLVLFAGCTSNETRFAVRGRVTLDNVPVTKALITFVPASSSAPSGTGAVASIENGQFELNLLSGLASGEYWIRITDSMPELEEFEEKRFAEEIPIPSPTIPSRYAQRDAFRVKIDGTKSDLLLELQGPAW